MKPRLLQFAGLGLAVVAATTLAVTAQPGPDVRVAPAIPVPEPQAPEPDSPSGPPVETEASPGVEAVSPPAPDAREDVGAPTAPVAGPETTTGNRKEKDEGKPSDAPASPPAVQVPAGKPLDWEQNIVRVSILDDMRPVSLPVEGKEAMDRPADETKVPRIVSPYPPKALSPVPDGWQLFTDTNVPTRIHRVKLKDGRTIDIGVFPPALMPANPEAATLVLPKSAGNPMAALSAARRSQEESRAKIEMLLDALNRQLPAESAAPAPAPAP